MAKRKKTVQYPIVEEKLIIPRNEPATYRCPYLKPLPSINVLDFLIKTSLAIEKTSKVLQF